MVKGANDMPNQTLTLTQLIISSERSKNGNSDQSLKNLKTRSEYLEMIFETCYFFLVWLESASTTAATTTASATTTPTATASTTAAVTATEIIETTAVTVTAALPAET